jgi:hypothetical protein
VNEIYNVRVEWMDGLKRTYMVGGYESRPVRERDGVLVLHMGNSQYGPSEHVATISLANVREYKVTPK